MANIRSVNRRHKRAIAAQQARNKSTEPAAPAPSTPEPAAN